MLETGIPHFDRLLAGGLEPGDTMLVLGEAGTGKTTLCLQVAFAAADAGADVAFVTTFSESLDKLIGHAETYGFFEERLVEKRVHFRNLYPFTRRDLRKLKDAIVETVHQHDAKLLVLDGLASIRDLRSDDYEVRAFIYELGSALAAVDAATLITSSFLGRDGQHLPEQTMADGILVLDQEELGDRARRRIQVRKMRGRRHLLGRHSLKIDGDGIRVFPRIESWLERKPVGLSGERKSIGHDVLDAMMDGGPPAQSLTMVAGAPATGKTIAGLGFIMTGVEAGEPGVILSFRETPEQLRDKAASFGMELGRAVEEDRVRIVHRPPVDLDVDQVVMELRSEARAVGAERLLIDTIDDLDGAILDDRRRRGFMAAVAALLRQLDLTSVATLQVPQMAGPELDVGSAPIAVFAENLVLLRNVEYRGRLLRALSVVKMRDSAYDSGVRQYRVTAGGLTVLDPQDTEPGLLEGISSLPSEARVKREHPREERE